MKYSETFVLVPGAGGASSFWKQLSACLTARGHRHVSVDLPGPDAQAGMTEYAAIIAEAARGHAPVVLVAQSMGGFSAAWAAAEVPTAGLVLLNAMIPLPGETANEWWGATRWAEARRENDILEGRDPDADIDLDTVFLHDVPPGALDPDEPHRDEAEIAFTTPWAPPRGRMPRRQSWRRAATASSRSASSSGSLASGSVSMSCPCPAATWRLSATPTTSPMRS